MVFEKKKIMSLLAALENILKNPLLYLCWVMEKTPLALLGYGKIFSKNLRLYLCWVMDKKFLKNPNTLKNPLLYLCWVMEKYS